MQPERLDRKATERSFLNRYINPSDISGAIETNIATKRFYEYMSALNCMCRCASYGNAQLPTVNLVH